MAQSDINLTERTRALIRAAGIYNNLTVRQLALLHAVEDAPGLSTGAYADALGLAPPVVTRACDQFQAMGLLERVADNDDRRRVHIRLTQAGRIAISAAECAA